MAYQKKQPRKWVGGVQGWMDSKQAAAWLTISPRALTTLCLGDKAKGLSPRIAFTKSRSKKRRFSLAELYRYVESTRSAALGVAGVPHRVWEADEKLTKGEAAIFLGVSARTVQRMCAEKAITYYQPTRELRFLKSDLEAWLELAG